MSLALLVVLFKQLYSEHNFVRIQNLLTFFKMKYLLILSITFTVSWARSLPKGYDTGPRPGPPRPAPPPPPPFVPEVYDPKPYSFAYEVIDPLGDTNFGHRESSDGTGVVEGEYRVILPDGRTQIVT